MPRRKQPESLKDLSLQYVAYNAFLMCKKKCDRKEIRKYVEVIPSTISNEYTVNLLLITTDSFTRGEVDITAAFHPKCTKINFENTSFCMPPQLYFQLFASMDTMGELEYLKTNFFDVDSKESAKHIVMESRDFLKMRKLRVLRMFLRHEPNLISDLADNSPNLEEIEIYDSQIVDLLLLDNCAKLKKIYIDDILPSNIALHLLDTHRHLEYLHISDVDELLGMVTRTYPLKGFGNALKKSSPAALAKLLVHFPELEELKLFLNENTDLSPLNKLVHLKVLEINEGSASKLVCLRDECLPRLNELCLFKVTGLTAIFGQEIKARYKLGALFMDYCAGIDVVAIGRMFPKISYLRIWRSACLPLVLARCSDYPTPFQDLQRLNVGQVPKAHTQYMLAFSNSMQNLYLETTIDMDLCHLLKMDSLRGLRALSINNDRMEKDVLPVIFQGMGDELKCIHIRSRRLEEMTSEEVDLLGQQLQMFDISVSVEGSQGALLLYECHGFSE